VVFLASIPIAYLISPGMARISWLLLVVVNPVVGTWITRGLMWVGAVGRSGALT
jgi:hypothetical protein